MGICMNCGREMDEPMIYYEQSECFGFPAYEEFRVCPYCGGPVVDPDNCYDFSL